ncbi:MAG: metallophosphoesterase [Desulfurococcales archaeon]|nr:metallophosphoesterase [Desulfurococcales archaeon]
MEVKEGVYLLEDVPGIYVEKLDAVVVADLHLGYEESMAKQGVFLPRLQLRKALKHISKAQRVTGAKRLIIDGDLKHEFSKLLKSEKLESAKLISTAFQLGFREIILVRGNHDNYIKPIIESLGGEVVEDLEDGDILLTHGHKKAETDAEVIIIGHEHPSISVSIGGAKARFPVFLIAPLRSGSIVVVLPALGAYQTGNPVSLDWESYLSPIMREKVETGEIVPVIFDEKEGLMPLPKLSVLQSIV